MTHVKSCSTGKSKTKRFVSATECLSCPKLRPTSARKNDHEKPQPIKVAQLIKQSENAKSIQKNSVLKQILPERLGTLSCRKNKRTCDKEDKTGIHHGSKHFKTRVRRNLNFNEDSISDDNNTKSEALSSLGSTHEEVSERTTRQSFLMPPNFIKDKYLTKQNGNVSRYSKRPESVEKRTQINKKNENQKENRNIQTNTKLSTKKSMTSNSSARSENKRLNHKSETFKQSNQANHGIMNARSIALLPQTPVGITTSLIPSISETEEQVTVEKNDKTVINKTTKKNAVAKNKVECIESLYNDLQNATAMVPSHNRIIRHNSSEMIYVNKAEIIELESNLKSMLSYVTRLLSSNDDQVSQMEKQEYCTSKNVTSKIMLDKEVQVEMCCKEKQQLDNDMKTSNSNVEVVSSNAEPERVDKLSKNSENKENQEIVSTRKSPDADESFIELENQLNIKHAKRPSMNEAIQQITPLSIKFKQKRSLREYMALKSTMSFLETPDVTKFKSVSRESSSNNPDPNKSYISKKIFTDLHNLYCESPEL